MPDNLYMSFNQEFSEDHTYLKTIICPSASYSFWSDTPDISVKVGQTLIWENLLSETIKDNYGVLDPNNINNALSKLKLSSYELPSQLRTLSNTVSSLRNELSTLSSNSSISSSKANSFSAKLDSFSSTLSALEDKVSQINTNLISALNQIRVIGLLHSTSAESSGEEGEISEGQIGFVITKIHVSDEVIGERNGYPFRQWLITLDGYIQKSTVLMQGEEPAVEVIINSYSISVEKLENRDTLFKISIETINYGDAPEIKCSIGKGDSESSEASSNFFADIPGVPAPFTCTNYSYSDTFNELNLQVWTVVYEGFAIVPHEEEVDDDDLAISTSYELNGSIAYTVDGDIVALRRSETPITKSSITTYTDSADRITTPGDVYQGGIVLSESVMQETVKNNNVLIHSYYKHTIEIEGGADSGSEHEEADGA